ncbi:RNA polymerase sigma factor [Chloroflexota bacterium]
MNEFVNTRDHFADLYEEFLPKVFRYVQYKVSNMQLAEDLTSTVFEKTLINFSKYSKDKAKFSTWLFSIARNTIIDHYRVQSKREAISLEETAELSSEIMSPDEELVKKEDLKKLRANLPRLSSKEQEIIALKFGAELNNRQIAERLNLSESNVGTKLYRAIRKLRDNFQESENE